MKSRQNVTIIGAVAAAAVVALAGCSQSTPEPAPTPAAGSGCAPGNSEITWGRSSQPTQNTPVGTQVMTVRADGVTETETIEFGVEPLFPGDALNRASDFDADARELWQDTLIEDAKHTGQVEENYGGRITLGTEPYIKSDAMAPGTYVTLVESAQQIMPFTIECEKYGELTGSITTVTQGFTASTQYDCATEYPEATENQLMALEYCPA